MSKRRIRYLLGIWIFVSISIRILFYLIDYKGVSDPYGMFDNAFMAIETKEMYLDSGLGFAYVNALSRLIRVFGSNIGIVFVYHLILEQIASVLIVISAKNFWGIYSSISISILLMLSPILALYLRTCSPEHYFFYHISVLFVAQSFFYSYSHKKSWFRSTLGEVLILLMGIYDGMLCVWNYLGIMGFASMFLIVFKNYRIIKDKAALLRMTDGDELEEKDQMMNLFVQTAIMLFGTTIGVFATLMKYTGYSGLTVPGQLMWWLKQFLTLPQRTMEVDTFFAVYIVLAVITGSMAGGMVHRIKKPAQDRKKREMEEALEKTENFVGADSKSEAGYFIAPDGRKIEYLDNPLPGPKKSLLSFDNKEEEKVPLVKFDIKAIMKENRSAVIYDENLQEESNVKVKSLMDFEGEVPGYKMRTYEEKLRDEELRKKNPPAPLKDPYEGKDVLGPLQIVKSFDDLDEISRELDDISFDDDFNASDDSFGDDDDFDSLDVDLKDFDDIDGDLGDFDIDTGDPGDF